MGILLTLSTYAVLALFMGTALVRFATLWNAARTVKRFSPPLSSPRPFLFLRMAGDVLFLTRLLKANDLLWIGEWTFHASFLLVLLRHLRFFLTPVPEWVWHFQTIGLIAGYILPLSLFAILIMKAREAGYFPFYNLFLVILLLFISATGLLMQDVLRSDIVNIKGFMTGIFTFNPAASPDGMLFTLHFSLVLVFAALLPSHIFTAPFVIVEARRREEGMTTLIHDE